MFLLLMTFVVGVTTASYFSNEGGSELQALLDKIISQIPSNSSQPISGVGGVTSDISPPIPIFPVMKIPDNLPTAFDQLTEDRS